jgi:hypothetical protein
MWIQWIYIAVKAGLWGQPVFTAIWKLFVLDHKSIISRPYSILDPTRESPQNQKLTITEKVNFLGGPIPRISSFSEAISFLQQYGACSFLIIYSMIFKPYSILDPTW